jgi:hypothetical protein
MNALDSSSMPMPMPTEQEWVEKEMRGFNWENSQPWRYLTQRFGDHMSKSKVLALGQVCAAELKKLNPKIRFDREYTRRKGTMIKWFSDHWDLILPFLENHVHITFAENSP